MMRLLALITGSIGLSSIPIVAEAAGGDSISDLALGLITIAAPLWVTVAVLIIVIAGFVLVLSHDEGATEKARKTIISVVIGGMIITLLLVLDPVKLIGFVYDATPGFVVPDTSALIGEETEGIASWIASMVAIAGILTIIVAMIRAVASFGGDDGAYTNVRTALLHVVLGMITIAAAYVLRDVFFVVREPSPLLAFIANIITMVLGIITFIAVVILIYAGVRMVTSFGREEDFSAAKSLLLRVIIGLLVILISFALVQFVVQAFNG